MSSCTAINQITENLFVGSSLAARDKKILDENNITAVVNVAKDLNDPWFDGIKSFKVGLMDGDSPENAGQYVRAWAVVASLIRAGERVLVHCHEGRSRSCAVAAIALVLDGKASHYTEAVKMVHENRPGSHIKDGHLAHIEEAINLIKGC